MERWFHNFQPVATIQPSKTNQAETKDLAMFLT